MAAATAWYRDGTIAVTNGSKAVTGTGTAWLSQILPADMLYMADANGNLTAGPYEVETVNSDTAFALKAVFPGATASAAKYFIVRHFNNTQPADLSARLSKLIANYQITVDQLIALLTSSGQVTITGLDGNSYTVLGLLGYANQVPDHNANDAAHSMTATGRAILRAADAAVARSVIGALASVNPVSSGTMTHSGGARFDGNVGVGVTPSAWNTAFRCVEFSAGSLSGISKDEVSIQQNAFYDASGWTRKVAREASQYRLNGATHTWYTSPSSTAGSAISWTQAMTLTSAGELLLGRDTAIANQKLVVSNNSGNIYGVDVSTGGLIQHRSHGWGVGQKFTVLDGVGNEQAMTLTSAGELLLGRDTAIANQKLVVSNNSGNIYGVDVSTGGLIQHRSHGWGVGQKFTVLDGVGNEQAMTLTSAGNLLVGVTSGTNHIIEKAVSEGNNVLSIRGANLAGLTVRACANGGYSTTQAALFVPKNSVTSKSINAAGTINASGADYAEYERNNGLTIPKGAIVGFNADGKLTLSFDEAISFSVKSTDPCLVGGDVWGTEEAIGTKRPEQPQFTAPEYAGSQKPADLPARPVEPALTLPLEPVEQEGETKAVFSARVVWWKQACQEVEAQHAQAQADYADALAAWEVQADAHAAALAQFEADQAAHKAAVEAAQAEFDTVTFPAYQRALAEFEAALEAARQQVDRIAYSGKVPCNVKGANPGDYIVAIRAADGGIAGVAISEDEISFAQYRKAVGRVRKIEADGRANIAVMVH